MATKNYVQIPTAYLSGSGVVIAATTITINSFTDVYGNVLTMTDFGDKGYATVEPDTTNEESFIFTTVTTNANGTVTLGGIASSLAKSPYTETSGLTRAHVGGSKVVVSDTVAFWNTFANKANSETVTGKYTFPGDNVNRPTLGSDVDTVTATDMVTLGQLSRQAISGAANASTTVKGIVQLPTQAQVDAKITTGSTAALLVVTPDKVRSTLLSDYVVDTGAANAYVITPVPAITAYTTGQMFTFKAVNANTTASTVNVNGLGVKTIKKLGGATDLGGGDIAAGQIVQLEYDGTNFQLLSPVSNSSPTGMISPYAGSTAPGGWLLADGTAVSRTINAALFAVTGTTFGVGDGSTTFNLPNLKGRVPVGYDVSQTEFNTVGKTGGAKTHTLITAELPAHSHVMSTNSATYSGGSGNMPSNITGAGGFSTQNTGSDTAHNNLQPYIAINYIIKL